MCAGRGADWPGFSCLHEIEFSLGVLAHLQHVFIENMRTSVAREPYFLGGWRLRLLSADGWWGLGVLDLERSGYPREGEWRRCSKGGLYLLLKSSRHDGRTAG